MTLRRTIFLLLFSTILLMPARGFNTIVDYLPVGPVVDNIIAQEELCLKTALHFEARGEPKEGILAVTNVIINRTKSKKFPNSICGVVRERNKYTCQFSWYCEQYTPPVKFDARILSIAQKAIHGKIPDITGGALFFHNKEIPIWESREIVASIGNHIFYK